MQTPELILDEKIWYPMNAHLLLTKQNFKPWLCNFTLTHPQNTINFVEIVLIYKNYIKRIKMFPEKIFPQWRSRPREMKDGTTKFLFIYWDHLIHHPSLHRQAL